MHSNGAAPAGRGPDVVVFGQDARDAFVAGLIAARARGGDPPRIVEDQAAWLAEGSRL